MITIMIKRPAKKAGRRSPFRTRGGDGRRDWQAGVRGAPRHRWPRREEQQPGKTVFSDCFASHPGPVGWEKEVVLLARSGPAMGTLDRGFCLVNTLLFDLKSVKQP